MPLTKVTGGEIDGASSINVTGIVTATSFSGNLTGNVTGTASTAQGLTGTPNISVGVITATSITATNATFTGNVSIAGTVTYDDVTNVDSIGLVTARSGVRIDAGGLVVTSGVSTFTNSPVLIGAATSTGTASQPLQVTGGAYVSGNLGIGSTSPTSKLQVVGDARVSGIVTAFDFYNDAEYPSVRPTLDLAFAQTKVLDSRITFTRSSTATYVNASGLIATAAVNEARFDHNPATGESLGLLVEESRTNLFTNSNPWAGGSNITWTSSQVSPTGGTESYNMVETAANNIHGLSILGGGFTTDYNRHISVFAKSAGRRYLVFWAALGAYPGIDSPECIFDLQSGTVVYLDTSGSGGLFETASITNFGNGWYRCGIYLNPYTLANRTLYILMSNSASPQQSSYTGDGSSGVTLFGLQLEEGAFPTSYIPTSGSTVTRSADFCYIDGTNFSSWYNQSEGTFYSNFKTNYDSSNGRLFRVSNITIAATNRIDYVATVQYHPYIETGAVVQTSLDAGDLPANTSHKIAVGLSSSGASSTINGGSVISSGTITLPTSNRLEIGGTDGGGTTFLNGTLSRFTYYPKRLTNSILQTITL